MTPEEMRQLQQAYEDACKNTRMSMQLLEAAQQALEQSRELMRQANEVALRAKAGDA